jgi:NADPH-dependent 2,4-dienoyl-CoA reductase/sulfur reductase-like enzyme
VSDVVIVGAGPAGMSCALALADAGVPSVLLDDNAEAGGQIFRTGPGAWRLPHLPGKESRGDDMRTAVARHKDLIDYRPRTQVIGLHAGPVVWCVDHADQAAPLTPRALVLATGALEVSVPVPGWTLPGVYGLGGLQTLVKSSALVPQGPVVLGGAGPLLYLLGAQLVTLGVEIAAVVDAAGWPSLAQIAGMLSRPALLARGLGFEMALRRRGIPILRSHAVIEVVGDEAPREVVVATVDDTWRPWDEDDLRRIPANVVGLGYGIRPNLELSLLAGCEHDFDPHRGGWHVRRDGDLMTTVEGVFAAGDGAAVGGVDRALAEGRVAARSVCRRLGGAVRFDVPDPATFDRFRDAIADWSAVRPNIFHAANGDTVICRCEDVRRADLEAGLANGIDLPRGLKMATRMGMGLCQGRTCAPALQHLTARATGRPLAEIALPTVRTPVRPVSMAALAQLPLEPTPSERTT